MKECKLALLVTLDKDRKSFTFSKDAIIQSIELKGSNSGTGGSTPPGVGSDSGWWTYNTGDYWSDILNSPGKTYKCFFYLGGMPHKITLTRAGANIGEWTTTRHAKTLMPKDWRLDSSDSSIKYTKTVKAGASNNSCFYENLAVFTMSSGKCYG